MKLRIEKIGINGEGIAYYQHKPVFVEELIPGDIADITLEKQGDRFYRGTCKKLLQRSSFYQKPICPLQKECGGCAMMHMVDDAQNEWKRKLLIEAVYKYGNVKEHFVRDMHSSEKTLGYRSACKLPVQEHNGKLVTGMYKIGTNHFVPIEDCLVHHPALETFRKQILNVLNRHQLSAYSPKTKQGLRYLVLRHIQGHGQCTLVTGNDNITTKLIDELMSIPTMEGLFQSIQTNKKTHEVFGPTTKLLAGNATIRFEMLGIPLYLSPTSFFQLNIEQAEKLYAMAIQKLDTCSSLVEAYCGVGAMSLLAHKKAKHILGIEYVPEAIQNAKQSALELHLDKQIQFVAGEAAKELQHYLQHHTVDALLVDPPRSGLDDKMIQTILSSNIHRIIYISCNPATLGKNLKQLKRAYQVRTIIPFDLFPNTPQVESLTVLERG